ncbi:MAG: TatD family hydrolase, partial [bacterium]
ETDSPFLPPVPFRGKKNEPSFIVHTLKKISDIKNIAPRELEGNILDNVNTLFFNKS